MAPGQPKEEPKPQPIGYMPIVVLLTTCMLCALFILVRRADGLRRVVSHQLKTFTRREGDIRLSEDDGPPAREFLEDDYDDDNEVLPGDNSDDEPLAHHAQHGDTRQTKTSLRGNAGDDEGGARQGFS